MKRQHLKEVWLKFLRFALEHHVRTIAMIEQRCCGLSQRGDLSRRYRGYLGVIHGHRSVTKTLHTHIKNIMTWSGFVHTWNKYRSVCCRFWILRTTPQSHFSSTPRSARGAVRSVLIHSSINCRLCWSVSSNQRWWWSWGRFWWYLIQRRSQTPSIRPVRIGLCGSSVTLRHRFELGARVNSCDWVNEG